MATKYKRYTDGDSDVVIISGPCKYLGMVCCFTTSDNVIRLYDQNTAAAFTAANLIDICGQDVSLEGQPHSKQNIIWHPVYCKDGIAIDISAVAGTTEIFVYYE